MSQDKAAIETLVSKAASNKTILPLVKQIESALTTLGKASALSYGAVQSQH